MTARHRYPQDRQSRLGGNHAREVGGSSGPGVDALEPSASGRAQLAGRVGFVTTMGALGERTDRIGARATLAKARIASNQGGVA